MMPLVCEEPVTRQAYALGANFYAPAVSESMRVNLLLQAPQRVHTTVMPASEKPAHKRKSGS